MKNSKTLLSNEYISSLRKQNSTSYFEFISDIREDLSQGFDTPVVSIGFMEKLTEFMKDDALKEYNSYTHYWSQLIEKIVYLIQLHEEIEFKATGELIEELTQFWEDSEYSASFEELSQEGASLIDASDSLKTLLENQILSFFHLHLASNVYKVEDVLLYSSLAELGDHETRICLGLRNKFVSLGETSDIYPLVGIKGIDPQDNSIELEINTDDYEAPLEDMEFKKECEGIQIFSLNENFYPEVEKALINIKSKSIETHLICVNFLSALVESDSSVVSFNLPGHCLVDRQLRGDKLMIKIVELAAESYFHSITYNNEIFKTDDEEQQIKLKDLFVSNLRNIYLGVELELDIRSKVKEKHLTAYGKKLTSALY